MRKRVRTGIIYIAVPITKENYRKLARLIGNNLERCRGRLMIVYENYAELISVQIS